MPQEEQNECYNQSEDEGRIPWGILRKLFSHMEPSDTSKGRCNLQTQESRVQREPTAQGATPPPPEGCSASGEALK